MADQHPSDQCSLSETVFNTISLFALEPSHLGYLLWIRFSGRSRLTAEMCVHWGYSWGEHLWGMKTAGRKRELKCHADTTEVSQSQGGPGLERPLQVVLYKGRRLRLCSLHPSLDVGYLWEGVVTLFLLSTEGKS